MLQPIRKCIPRTSLNPSQSAFRGSCERGFSCVNAHLQCFRRHIPPVRRGNVGCTRAKNNPYHLLFSCLTLLSGSLAAFIGFTGWQQEYAKMATDLGELLVPYMPTIRVPRSGDRVYKSECAFSYDSPVSSNRKKKKKSHSRCWIARSVSLARVCLQCDDLGGFA